MLIKVKAYPEAGKEEVIEKEENSFEIWVKEKPIQGQANRAILRALAEYLEVDQGKIRLVKGFKQRNKVYEFNN